MNISSPSLLYAYFRVPRFKSHPSIHPDPDDYTGGSFTVLIPAGTMKETLSVNTVADNLVEGDEFFKATLSLPGAPEAVEVGTPNMAFVNITDDDGKFWSTTLSIMHAPLVPNHSAIP